MKKGNQLFSSFLRFIKCGEKAGITHARTSVFVVNDFSNKLGWCALGLGLGLWDWDWVKLTYNIVLLNRNNTIVINMFYVNCRTLGFSFKIYYNH